MVGRPAVRPVVGALEQREAPRRIVANGGDLRPGPARRASVVDYGAVVIVYADVQSRLRNQSAER